MARTGMIARGLRAMHRMSRGDSTVYVLAKTTGADTLTSLGSTEDAYLETADGTTTLHLTEDATVTPNVMERAAAFALASTNDGTFRVWRRTETATPAVGQLGRAWSFTIAPTGVVFSLGNYFLLEAGVDQIAMEDSGLILTEA